LKGQEQQKQSEGYQIDDQIHEIRGEISKKEGILSQIQRDLANTKDYNEDIRQEIGYLRR